MTDAPRWTSWDRVRDLVPATWNPKDHDLDALDASLREFGYIEPVVIDERTGALLSGHGRTEKLTQGETAGLDPPEGIMLDGDGAWLVLTVHGVRSRDDDHAKAMVVALNRVGERGGWKRDLLADVLESLSPTLLEGSGFTADELTDLLASTRAPNLDDLADRYGEHDPSNLWPVLRFKVPPTVRDRYLRLVEGIEGGDDVLFAHVIDRAERP